ncbi:hypothetical protein LSA36186_05790 [Lachnoanaerobaculum sp. JCM 36186]|nr:hypothetical protein LSA36186_05790 [Lachnoanaerobaculum sp. JCM 36186]
MLKKCDELEYLKNNMNEYLGRTKNDKRESVIGTINKHRLKDIGKPKVRKKTIKEI